MLTNTVYSFFIESYRASVKTRRMTLAEHGLYRNMLDQLYLAPGSLTDDYTAVAEVLGFEAEEVKPAWERVRACFSLDEKGYLTQARVQKQLKETVEQSIAKPISTLEPTKNHLKHWNADHALTVLKEAAGEVLVDSVIGTKGTAGLNSALQECEIDDFRLVGEFIAAGEFFTMKSKGDKCVQLSLVLSQFKTTLSSAKVWDKNGRNKTTSNFQDITESEEENTFKVDVDAVLALYPKRENRVGYPEGVRILKNTITSQEEYDQFMAALRAYAKSCKGKDRTYVVQMNKFMSQWRAYLPDNFVATPEAKPSVSATPVAPLKQMTAQESLAATRQRQATFLEGAPWHENPYWSQQEKDALAARWPEERRRRYLNGEDVDNFNSTPNPVDSNS